MRRLILAFAIAVPLAACGKSDEGNGTAAGSAMTAEAIATNDVTAIDAVTGEAANMAADVDLDANLDGNATGNAAADGERPSQRPAPASSAPARTGNTPPAAQPAPDPQANSAE